MKAITRTIPVSKIHASVVTFEEGALRANDLPVIEVFGEEIKKDAAMKHVAKVYGKENTYLVKAVEVDTPVYEISLDEFLKAAKKIEPKQDAPAAEAAATQQ